MSDDGAIALDQGGTLPDPLRPSLVERDGAPVLVVEDDRFVLAIMQRVIAQAGFDVIAANDHDSALEAARGRVLAAAVTDLVLPGGSGYDLATVLRARQPGLPVLLVSGHEVAEGLQSDVLLLRKPFSPSQLLAELGSLLRASTG